uniref:Uncharacterized protein n=1 Tax=Anguilla anguilla TaxID=7936 RepID=A0A0E9V5F5_ANGAN
MRIFIFHTEKCAIMHLSNTLTNEFY